MRSPPASVTPRPFPPADLDDLQDDLAAEITYRRHLVPQRPPRSYTRSQKRPGGRFATKKPADRPARAPRTTVIFWSSTHQSKLTPLGQTEPTRRRDLDRALGLCVRWSHSKAPTPRSVVRIARGGAYQRGNPVNSRRAWKAALLVAPVAATLAIAGPSAQGAEVRQRSPMHRLTSRHGIFPTSPHQRSAIPSVTPRCATLRRSQSRAARPWTR